MVDSDVVEELSIPKKKVKNETEPVKNIGEIKEEIVGDKTAFYIDLTPRRVSLPKVDDLKKINVRYPLMPPFAFAHIFWDDKNKELIYFVEEPILSETEAEILRILRMGLNEMINISLVKAKKFQIVIQYLEESVQSILVELGTKISPETYKKLMYYIYRDSIGFNQIEPLINDYYIEDIECNGVNTPLYLVHRKYENIKTNIIFSSNQQLVDFVEKLAQKAGKYVSYARPLLDAALPDGSRVNATYSNDVTTRGPTFTIRKFTKDPWTPMHLMEQGTADARVFAYLWLAIENKFNIMVIGETASGKTTFLNSIISLVPPEARISSIEDTRELNLAHENWLPAVARAGFGLSTNGKLYGEITIFELLRETFRQTPDYVILGETRGEETYVLFQGMASGHPSFCTFHAGSVETLIRRLETAPINLPSSLVESLDIICVVNHIKTPEKNMRRLREIKEIISVAKGRVNANTAYQWVPATDKIIEGAESHILNKISNNTGIAVQKLRAEIALREKILQTIYDKKIFDYKEFGRIIATYYRDPKAILEELGLKGSALVGKTDMSINADKKEKTGKEIKKEEKTIKTPTKRPIKAMANSKKPKSKSKTK
ncbi:MAG: type II/IV secretion system ATPase subunit [Nanoarchaeota archaeon]|nr:type II/IV secretion system ATPase subunit [Nanoarchaeota archaeon]